jgi:hypothetical protein
MRISWYKDLGESTNLQQNREISDIRIDYNILVSEWCSRCAKYPKISSRISAGALLPAYHATSYAKNQAVWIFFKDQASRLSKKVLFLRRWQARFLILFSKRWLTCNNVSLKVPTPRTLELLAFCFRMQSELIYTVFESKSIKHGLFIES